MLAKFENGYFLEVLHNVKDNEYNYKVYNEEYSLEDTRWTEYRNIEMYYPMNEIDYILEFCEPDDLEGKYELLKQETMDEYLEEFLKEDPNGEWILERQGTDNDDIRYYRTEEAAKTTMLREAEEKEEDVENVDLDDEYCVARGEEYFQCWKVYKKEIFETEKEKLFNKIKMEFNRIDTGISQYAWELQDTYVIRYHVEKLETLVEKLKEMVN